MSLIQSRKEAARLARLLVLDLPINHGDAVRAGLDISAEIAEARARFHQRVDPRLHDVYETKLAEMLAAMRGSSARETPTTSPRTREWSEVDDDAELGTVITFEGVDLDEQSALDVENFARAVQSPAPQDAGGAAMIGSEYGEFLKPMNALGLGLGALFAFVAYEVLDGGALGAAGWNSPTGAIAIVFVTFLFVIGALLPMIVVRIKASRARPLARSTTHAFRLGLSSAHFVVERAGFRLALEIEDIERFEGGERLSVLRRSGKDAVVLPCGLNGGAHAALAERLNEVLREHRGYRG